MFNAEAVDPVAETITSMEGTAGLRPPRRDPATHLSDFVEWRGLGDGGWVDVDKHTLEATGFDDVYAIGDAAQSGVTNAGSPAHYRRVVAQRSEVTSTASRGGCLGGKPSLHRDWDGSRHVRRVDYERPPEPSVPIGPCTGRSVRTTNPTGSQRGGYSEVTNNE